MFHSESTDHQDSSAPQPVGSVWRRLLSRGVTYAVGGSFIAVLIYAVVFSMRIANGVARSVDIPTHIVRLQILNASGVRGLTAKLSEQLSGYSDADVEISVVDTSLIDATRIPASFVISREKETDNARLLCQKIGLDPSTVVSRPLIDNRDLVTATLVVGDDYSRIVCLSKKPKEK